MHGPELINLDDFSIPSRATHLKEKSIKGFMS
jgi:hypothetical protein